MPTTKRIMIIIVSDLNSVIHSFVRHGYSSVAIRITPIASVRAFEAFGVLTGIYSLDALVFALSLTVKHHILFREVCCSFSFVLCSRDDFKPIGYSYDILKETIGTRNRKATIIETNTVWVAL